MPFFKSNFEIAIFLPFKRNLQEKFLFFSPESFLSFFQLFAYFFKREVSQVQTHKRHLNDKHYLKEDLWPHSNNNNKRKNVKNTIWHSLHFSLSTRLDNNWVFSTAAGAADSFFLHLEKKNICFRAKMSQFLRYCRFSYFVGW